jgi:hypothetical protein
MKIAFVGMIGAASLVASADAGFAGFVAFSRNVGANTVIDVFAAVDNASDRFLNVYNTTSSGSFVQKPGLAYKTWKPDAANFTATRSVGDDSFMTAGTFSGAAYGGEFYASTNTNADPNFTGTSWNGTPASAAATTIPSLAGWYTGDPTSIDNSAELMSAWGSGFTRSESLYGTSTTVSGVGTSAGKQYGIWVSHLVVAGTNKVIGTDFTFQAFVSIKDGVTQGTDQRGSTFTVPAPGAIALLGMAGALSRRARR